ncbi:hypothetical protein FB382_001019 [Nocardioides ginsengisegetis]|uniref:Uncharacterized protein n=1 Tax=Nocardioides ginsengisegetis TaxID=661491 RepID=A0A7W3IY29_9ACTN|nr:MULTISPECIES: hypothetical protein [Nocardioides]MBA8802728.1 hypothetical protein [Nocardioides ginsengisegetis]GCD88427.1 hypothetical protein NLS1_04330 [Nocardioides sp. LS1]
MTDSPSSQADGGISDDQLPEDLRPTDDNPLAQDLDEDVEVDDLDMDGGKGADEWDDEQLED